MKTKLIAALFTLSLSSLAQAQITVQDPWVRATVAQQNATGAFMQINSAKDVRIIEFHSPAATMVELHKMEMSNNVMKMRAIDTLDIAAGKTLELKPGGYHVMLMGLKAQVKAGDIIPLTLVIEGKDKKRETLEIKAVAKPMNQTAAPAMSHH